MRRRVNIVLALALVMSVFAGAFGTASADHDEAAPSVGHAFLPWLPNGSELGDQGPYTGAVTVQNVEEAEVSVDVYVGQGDGWNLEETVTLASRESITLGADQINVPEPGASVILEGWLEREETMTCQEIEDDPDLDIANYPDCEVVEGELQNPDDEVVVNAAVAGRIAAVTKNASPMAATGGTTGDHEVVDGYSALTAEDVDQDVIANGDGTYILPVVQTNSGWNTVLRVANLSDEGGLTNATVTLYGSGTQGFAGQSQVVNLQLRPGQVDDINLADHVPADWVGSAFITSGADIGAVAERYNEGDDMLITNTSRPEVAGQVENGAGDGTVKYGSLVFQRYNFWNTGISVANVDPNETNNVTITYYGPTANAVGQDSLSIPPRGQEYVYTPGTQDLGLEEGFVGSVVIEGSAELHASIDQVKYFGEGNNVGHAMSYIAEGNLAQAGESLELPLAQKGNPQTGGGDTSGIQLFNPTDASATAEIVFYGANGIAVAPTVQNNTPDPLSVTLAPNQSYTLYTHELGELSSGFHGSVGIDVTEDSGGAIIGVSNNVNYDVQNDGSTAFNLIQTDPRVGSQLTLEPETATNAAGEDHTVTATLVDQFGAPMEGETIDFSVESTGSPDPASQSVETDAEGQATFSYTNPEGSEDVITAQHDESGIAETAGKFWCDTFVSDGESIQDAVNQAEEGDVICVEAGTYEEDLTIDKSLSLIGAQAGVDARDRENLDESEIVGGIDVTDAAGEVTIDGFTLTGTGSLPLAGVNLRVASAESTVRNNIVNAVEATGGYTDAGFFSFNSIENTLVEQNTFSGALDLARDPNVILVNQASGTVVIQDNEMQDVGGGGGIALVGDIDTVNVLNNLIDNTGSQGMFHFGGTLSELNVAGNTFTNNDENGILLAEGATTSSIHFNNIVGNADFGLNNQGSEPVDATDNWWGHESGPFHPTENPDGQGDAVSDNVDFDPWLTEPATN